MDKVNVGLVGYGFSGAVFHAPLLKVSGQFEITKVLTSRFSEVGKDIGAVEVVDKLDEILDDKTIELVIITTPNTLHYDMAKRSLSAGKHVVLEKPMVLTSKEAQELIDLAKQNNLMLSVYQNRRWDSDFLTVKELIDNENLGTINTYIAHYDRFNPEPNYQWREQKQKGSGMLYDLGSHLIDQALHLFGEPQEVFCDLWNQREASLVDDYFHIILGYQRMRVILHCGSIVKQQGPKYLIHGSKGSFIKYGIDGQEAALIAGELPDNKNWGEDKPEWYGTLYVNEAGQEMEKPIKTIPGNYPAYYQGIYNCLRHGASNPVPAEDGLRTIKLLETAVKSSKEKSVIRLY
ncbi:oxidoreductase [Sediminibacillus albus]|uniref:Scyllo-inositol 2-dehydrogenase (NADP+) n=1 Tax=Sediminibacillus albus TaxID=407036 RepID=A0A1G8ZVH7_9BACI|nr:oxidoreductase [Sediminibacillus albus]SDK19122.1 scyllo-inositol 2-dehydrogenase (NADP+) [Sediminibacillus albus]